MASSRLALSLSLTLFAVACGGEPPKMANPTKTDGVAANSASEAPAASSTSASATPTATADPSAPQPYMTPMNGAATGSSGSSASASTNGGPAPTGSAKSASTKGGKGGKGPATTSGGGEKATAAECKQAMDKAIDVMISGDSRFAGIPPEMLAQIKDQALTQAKGQQGDPCAKGDMTKAQYNCAMSAGSSAAIQSCLK